MKKQKNSLREKMPAHIGGWLLLIFFITVVIYACQNDEPETKIGTNDASGQSVAAMKPKNTTARTGALYTKEIGKHIPDDIANAWTRNYTQRYPDGILSHTFGADAYYTLLNQKGAVGIRLKHAINDSGAPQILMVAIDGNGKELVGSEAEGHYDASDPCPPCDPDSAN
jgi:hypothetical protein